MRFEPEIQGLLRLVLDGMARRREGVAAGASRKGRQQILAFPGHDCRVAHRHISISFSLYRIKSRSSHLLLSSDHDEHSRTTPEPLVGCARGSELPEGLALLDLRSCRAGRDAVHSCRRPDPLRAFSTARLDLRQGPGQGLKMASVYRKGGRSWLRFKGADGRWPGAPAKARTKPAARLDSKIGELSLSTLNHLRAYCHRLYAVASMRSVGWWMAPNPVNRLELPKFKEAKRKRGTVAAEDVPRVLAALTPEWRPLFATAFFLGLRRGELLALQKEDIDLREWTITVRRSNEADVTKGGDDGTVPIPEPLRPYLDAAIKLSPSKWVFPAADGTQRAPDTNLKAVLRRACGRAGIVEGYEHRCRKPGCGHVQRANDSGNRRCANDGRALWIRPLPKKGIVFHSLRHTTATLLARAKVHPSVAQKILRHANIETTLAIYTHIDGIEDMRAAVAKLDFGPLA